MELPLLETQTLRVALVGNPNCGKSSLFNALTGLNQKVGNYAGVTVDRVAAKLTSSENRTIELSDLPGAYSLYPKSLDEAVVRDVLLNDGDPDHPDLVLCVLDASNLQRHLFLASQVLDLGIPAIGVLNMNDVAQSNGVQVDMEELSAALGIPFVTINARNGSGTEAVRTAIERGGAVARPAFTAAGHTLNGASDALEQTLPQQSPYKQLIQLHQLEDQSWLTEKQVEQLRAVKSHLNGSASQLQLDEISERYRWIKGLIRRVTAPLNPGTTSRERTNRADRWLTHPVWGSGVFLAVFFVLFQSIFWLAAFPMDWIDQAMGWFTGKIAASLPEGLLTSFLTDGLLAGLAGVVVFLPQIMILFGLITLLEDSGYMARVSFLNDRVLRAVGMNGKAVVPLVGGFACAIPAIMAARAIENKKERLITMMVTPLMSCSARLPVYIFLVAFVVPDQSIGGIFNLQGLVMLGLYALGVFASVAVALVLSRLIPGSSRSSFSMELPEFKIPRWKNVLNSMWNKGRTFVMEAGKVIVVVSMVLWVLTSFGPADERDAIRTHYGSPEWTSTHSSEETDRALQRDLLESSYAGKLGGIIEPVIRPLGMDWRMGIALITSFAAREVFVGTMASIYALGTDADNIAGLQAELQQQTDPTTGKPYMNLAVAASLLMFYVFALQCMSTVAVMRKETGGWKWPAIQFVAFTALAYISSLVTYQWLS